MISIMWSDDECGVPVVYTHNEYTSKDFYQKNDD